LGQWNQNPTPLMLQFSDFCVRHFYISQDTMAWVGMKKQGKGGNEKQIKQAARKGTIMLVENICLTNRPKF
jgi:hypothetical protein